MKFKEPANNNYTATVVTIKQIVPLKANKETKAQDCDNVVGTPLFGAQAIVGKDTKVGDIGIVFPHETQLSEDFVYENNLFRHTDQNKDDGKAGYLEDNRRVRGMKFRGHRSDCLFLPLSSLKYTKVDISKLEEGDSFDEINGKEICKKFLRKVPKSRIEKNKKDRSFVRVEKKFMPEHYATDQFFKNEDAIPPNRRVVVTQKIHGTSIRIGHTIVKRKLKPQEKLAKKLGVKVQDTEFDYVYGSRRSIKDINNPNQQHFYKHDIWTEEGKKLQGLIPENFLVFAELVGWNPDGGPIQKNYTYKIAHGISELYVYRVAHINGEGRVTDLTWDQIKEFCRDIDIKHVPELWSGQMKDFNPREWLDVRFNDELHGGYPQALPLDKGFIDEGICIRVDGLTPYTLKAKSPMFLQHETKMKDEEVADTEEDEEAQAEA